MRFQWIGFGFLGLAITLGVMANCGQVSFGRRSMAPCILAVFAAMTYVAWRCHQSPVKYFGREDLALAGCWFVTYAGIGYVFNRSRDRGFLMIALGSVVLMNLILVSVQAVGDPTQWILPGYVRSYADRPGGVFNNPHHLAALCSAFIPVLLSLAIFDQGGRRLTFRVTLFVVSALLFFIVIMTKSRSGLLAASAGLTVFAIIAILQSRRNWPEYRKFINGLAVALALLVGLGIAGLSKDFLSERFDETHTFDLHTEANRPLIWQSALEQHRESPWIGTGARTFYFFSRKHRSPEMHSSVPEADFAHNEYLQVLADYGWIGLVLVALVVLTHGFQGFFFLKDRSPKAPIRTLRLALTIGAIASLVALGVNAAINFSLHTPIIAMMSALFLGILAVPGIREIEVDNVPPDRSMIRSTLMSMVGVSAALLLIGAIKYAPSEWYYEQARHAFVEEPEIADVGSLNIARHIDPWNPFIHSLCGHYARRNDDLKMAHAHFTNAVRLYPQDVHTRLALAETLTHLSKLKHADKVLSGASKWAPLYGNIHQARGEIAFANEDIDAAEEHFRAAAAATAFGDFERANAGLDAVERQRRVMGEE